MCPGQNAQYSTATYNISAAFNRNKIAKNLCICVYTQILCVISPEQKYWLSLVTFSLFIWF